MSEFVSRWLTPPGYPEKTPETTKSSTAKTDKSTSVSSVSPPNGDFGRFSTPNAGWPTDAEWPGETGDAPPPAVLTGFAPLDDVIIASEAERYSLEQIEVCVARLTDQARRPEATPLERQSLQDWLAIRDAKRRMTARMEQE
ncbi:MAG: hypothetical protein M3464_12140 [Chloroflexota bacterium]|nr:hypothetical protein [Chloroflexota bacterium]